MASFESDPGFVKGEDNGGWIEIGSIISSSGWGEGERRRTILSLGMVVPGGRGMGRGMLLLHYYLSWRSGSGFRHIYVPRIMGSM